MALYWLYYFYRLTRDGEVVSDAADAFPGLVLVAGLHRQGVDVEVGGVEGGGAFVAQAGGDNISLRKVTKNI